MFDEFKNAFQRHNNAHVQLIIINVVVFLAMLLISLISFWSKMPELFIAVREQIAIPASFMTFLTRPWTILTYAFAHDTSGIMHILGNMLAFYWFGRLIVEYLGNEKLIALYVLGAIAGGVSFMLLYNTNDLFSGTLGGADMVGASASVYAVVVAAATLLPDYTFFLILIGPVRIKYIAAFYILLSLIALQGSANIGGNIAHIGGALMGFVYIKQLQAGNNWGAWVTASIDFIKKLFKPRSRVKITYRKSEPKKNADKPGFSKATQTEIDSILDKISDRGYESLTKDEKEKLFNASKKP